MAENRFYLDREALVVLVTELLTRLKAKISEISESSSSAETTLTERIQQLEDALLHYVYKDTVPVEGSNEALGKNEVIYGDKYFYDYILVDDFSYIQGININGHEGENVGLVEYIYGLLTSPDTKLVHTINDEIINGNKTFNDNIIVNSFDNILDSHSNTLFSYFTNNFDDSNLVHKTGDETIGGDKTFTGDIVCGTGGSTLRKIGGDGGFYYIEDSQGNNLLEKLEELVDAYEDLNIYGEKRFKDDTIFYGDVTFHPNPDGLIKFDSGTVIIDTNFIVSGGGIEGLGLDGFDWISSDGVSLLDILNKCLKSDVSGNVAIEGNIYGKNTYDFSYITDGYDGNLLDYLDAFTTRINSLSNSLNQLSGTIRWIVSSSGAENDAYDNGCVIRLTSNDDNPKLHVDFSKSTSTTKYNWSNFTTLINKNQTILLIAVDGRRGKKLMFHSYRYSEDDLGFYSITRIDNKVYLIFLKAIRDTQYSDSQLGSLKVEPIVTELNKTNSTSENVDFEEFVDSLSDEFVLKTGDIMSLKSPLIMRDSTNSYGAINFNILKETGGIGDIYPEVTLESLYGNKTILHHDGLYQYNKAGDLLSTISGSQVVLLEHDNNHLLTTRISLNSNGIAISNGTANPIFIGKLGNNNYQINAPKFVKTGGSSTLVLLANGDVINISELISLSNFFLGATTEEDDGVNYLVLNFSNQDPIRIPYSDFLTLPELTDYYNKNDNPLITADKPLSYWQTTPLGIPNAESILLFIDSLRGDFISRIYINGLWYETEGDGSVYINNIGGNGTGNGISSNVQLWGNAFDGSTSINGNIEFGNNILLSAGNDLYNNNKKKLTIKREGNNDLFITEIKGDLKVSGSITAGDNITAYSMEEESPNSHGKVLNVKGFGAKGNGEADDTEALERVFAEFDPEHPLPIVFPEGTYLIRRPLTLKSNMEIYGVGKAVIKKKAATTTILTDSILKNSNVVHVQSVSGFEIGDMLCIAGTQGSARSRFCTYGLITEINTNLKTITFDTSFITSNVNSEDLAYLYTGGCIQLISGIENTDYHVTNSCAIFKSWGMLYEAENIYIHDLTLDGNRQEGEWAEWTNSCIHIDPSSETNFSGASTPYVYESLGVNCSKSAKNLTVKNCIIMNSPYDGISDQSKGGGLFDGNKIINCYKNGIHFGSTYNHGKVVNNIIENCGNDLHFYNDRGVSSGFLEKHGSGIFWCENGLNIIVSSNTFRNCYKGCSDFGFSNSLMDTIITNNVFTGINNYIFDFSLGTKNSGNMVTSFIGNLIISNNLLEDCYPKIANLSNLENVVISNNIITNYASDGSTEDSKYLFTLVDTTNVLITGNISETLPTNYSTSVGGNPTKANNINLS